MRSKRIKRDKIKRYRKMILIILVLTIFMSGVEKINKETNIIIYQREIIDPEPLKQPIITQAEIEYIENEKDQDDEREILARLLYTEARGESIECQRAVVSVVLNRAVNSDIISVIKAKGQFDLGNKLDNIKPLQTQYDVVDYVLENGITIPSDVIYFRSGYFHTWATDYMQIDNTYFSR